MFGNISGPSVAPYALAGCGGGSGGRGRVVVAVTPGEALDVVVGAGAPAGSGPSGRGGDTTVRRRSSGAVLVSASGGGSSSLIYVPYTFGTASAWGYACVGGQGGAGAWFGLSAPNSYANGGMGATPWIPAALGVLRPGGSGSASQPPSVVTAAFADAALSGPIAGAGAGGAGGSALVNADGTGLATSGAAGQAGRAVIVWWP
jgi:hypothetical protein